MFALQIHLCLTSDWSGEIMTNIAERVRVC